MKMMNSLKIFISCILVAVLFITGCAPKEYKILYGDFVDAEGYTSAAYQKSYLFMDCCDGWDGFKAFVEDQEGVGAAEGFEYYLYDSKGNVIKSKKEIEISFHPTRDFKRRSGDVVVCSYPEGQLYNCVIKENGDISFKTKDDGIFVAMKYSDYKLWISNQYCTGQCSTCSDEW